mmetsp:Transcript_1751/g.2530  ORF Transcript_1751/g.2530 Transcript_1751/m.2530 type:complete len:84 (+) Transcript_1751:552-803(+)
MTHVSVTEDAMTVIVIVNVTPVTPIEIAVVGVMTVIDVTIVMTGVARETIEGMIVMTAKTVIEMMTVTVVAIDRDRGARDVDK